MKTINNFLRAVFYRLGCMVANHPKKFISIPIILTLCSCVGILRLEVINEFEYLYTPTNSRSVRERNVLFNYFPTNDSGQFTASRKATIGHFARIIVTTKDESNLLTTQRWKEIEKLDTLIHNLNITFNGQVFTYSDICSKWGDHCHENDIIELGHFIHKFESNELKIGYPATVNPVTFSAHTTGQYFSGVELQPDGANIISAKTLTLNYFVSCDETDEQKQRAIKWERALSETIRMQSKKSKLLKFHIFTVSSVSDQSNDNIIKVAPYVLGSCVCTTIYVVASLLMKDWVLSKPWLGIAAVTASAFGVVAGMCLILLLGVPFVSICMSIPFILIGIGIDDAFVLTAAWRRTNTLDPVAKRLAETYADASVSITITSLTDTLSFYVGIATPMPAIQIFSIYAGTTVFFIYLWQIFIFGGCLAISGCQEKENKHGLFWCIRAVPKSETASFSKWKKLLLTGGPEQSKKCSSSPKQMTFFRDTFSQLLINPKCRGIIVLSYIVYIIISLYGLLNIDERFFSRRLFREDSYMYEYNLVQNKYMPKFYTRLQVLITSPIDYSNITTQKEINSLISNISSLPFMTSDFAENWLRDFTTWAKLYKEFDDIDISTEETFIHTLQNKYLTDAMYTSSDIVFNDNNTKIIASRFILQVDSIVQKTADLAQVIQASRELVDQSSLNATIYNYWNRYIDETLMIRDLTLKLTAMAASVVLCVSMIFIPSLIVSSCVFFTIISTELGVVGFMSLWGISLDPLSLICLIVCVGFSVDFAAHFSYSFVTSGDELDVETKLRKSLHAVGLPVVQGALSTIIGVVPLYFVPSYAFVMFFKIIFLVISFSTVHALLILPVFLTFCVKLNCNFFHNKETYDVTSM